MAAETMQLVLLIATAIAAGRIARKFNIPEIIPLLVAGYVLGVDLLGFLKPESLGVSVDVIALAAIPVILFYDGMKTDVRNLRESSLTVLSINTVAVGVTVVGVAFFSNLFLGLSWVSSLLLGAILSSTDPVAIIPVLQRLNISKRLSTVLEAETALNDASAITIFTVILGLATGGVLSLRDGVTEFIYLAVLSTIAGAVMGLAFNNIFRQFRLEGDLVLGSAVVLLTAYSLAEYLQLSGVITAVATALVFRQYLQSSVVDSVNRLRTLNFWDDLNFLAVALVFLIIGAEIRAQAIAPYLGVGVLIALSFILVVRPVTVLISMALDKSFSLREKALIAWLGNPRGSVSAALAAIIVARAGAGLFPPAEAAAMFNITLVVIVVTVVIASATAGEAVKRLLKIREETAEETHRKLTAELKTMMVAGRRLYEEWRGGLVSTKIYKQIDDELKGNIEEMEKRLAELYKQEPDLEQKARAMKVREVLMTQISALQNSFENKEISETNYDELMDKFHLQLDRLEEIEQRKREKLVKSVPGGE